MTEGEIIQVIGKTVFKNHAIYQNDVKNERLYKKYSLKNGKSVKLHREIAGTKVLLTGSISLHYLAGFGGGRKSILPGIASYDTCLWSHKKTLAIPPSIGRHDKVFTGNLHDNPFNEIMDDVAEEISPTFLLNTTVNSKKEITGIFSGHWREAHRKGCDFLMERYSINIKDLADIVIVSCGGFPYDLNLIQAHKTLENVINVVKRGGTILLLAECKDGPGNGRFLNWFNNRSLEDFDRSLRGSFEINGQTAMSLFIKTKMADIILLSGLNSVDVKKMGMIPVSSLKQAEGFIVSKHGKNFNGYIIADGAKFYYN